jgi:hypothetical protein
MSLYIVGLSEKLMRKDTVYLFVLLTFLSLSLACVQKVSSQPEKIKVLSYSWYVDSIGFFDVVGEVQNVGPNTIESVVLGGIVYTIDGAEQGRSNPTYVYVNCLIPQQKASFFIEFSPQQTATGDLSWLSIGVDRVDFTVIDANVTNNYRYPDITVQSSSGAADKEGTYWVSGTVQNSGNQTATNIRVIATFYNATGTVVGVGYTEYLTPSSLSPSDTASFKVGAFDYDQTVVPPERKIASYSLLVQVEKPLLSGTPPSLPPSNSTSTTTPSDSTPSSTIAPETQYIAVIVVVILGVVGTILVLNKRKAKAQSTKNPKSQKREKQK